MLTCSDVQAPDSQAAGTTHERTVFRAFERSEFLEWPSWVRVRTILQANGGSYGLSGPRGAGKSWLMLRAIDEARAPEYPEGRRGIGLWYPSPSEYNALSFLASLSDALANEIERTFLVRSPFFDEPASVRFAVTATALYLLALSYFGYPVGASLSTSVSTLLGALALGLVMFTFWRFVSKVVASRRPGAGLLREAATMRARARYTSTLREGSELGAEGGRWVVGKWKSSREQELVERPSTLSSLVNDFRALAEHAGREAGRVVIAIDELDKMDDPRKVKDLLRDIKGVFDVPHVHFLVSVSDEAARSLNLGALTGRSEFNSSFYTVIELPPVSPSGCTQLLEHRAGVDLAVARVLGVLAGGNPREVLRLAEAVGDSTDPTMVVVRVLREEALNLRRDIVTAPNLEGRPPIGHEARIGSFRSLPDRSFVDPSAFLELSANALSDPMWEPSWRDEGWTAAFEEPWRRLLVRLAVGDRLIGGYPDNEERLLQLRDVITAASEGASVARIVLEEELRVDTRPSA